ncbi:hypothetical protein XELAEV_18028027mg [Xenopus laevis]|uniref:Uncharacterized protein n=1 Tax=Xenopus laevis TaxID=8355 RepID=A0A974HK61_XENLA|nr:hypothetical protein XELAEV_18028027mg [Xenopus laevis]
MGSCTALLRGRSSVEPVVLVAMAIFVMMKKDEDYALDASALLQIPRLPEEGMDLHFNHPEMNKNNPTKRSASPSALTNTASNYRESDAPLKNNN